MKDDTNKEEKIIFTAQRKKMKELWDNKEDKSWENC